MAKRFLSIKNFEKYQHYKNRLPPWIKLHLEILDDADFLKLPDASKWHYIGLLLLASRHENSVKCDAEYIKSRLGLTEKLDLTPRFLKDHLLASNASKRLLLAQENADSETEKSRDRGEREALALAPTQNGVAHKRGKRPISDEDKPTDKHFAFGKSLGIDVGPEWGKFKNYCLAHDKRYANFEAAFRNWLANAAAYKEKAHVVR